MVGETAGGASPVEIEPARRAATLKDVAWLARVDPSTVSRVLRGDPRQGVREDTRERILDAARVLNYRANALAQSLRTRRTNIFAVVVPTLDNPGFIEVIRGIQAEAAVAGKLVLLAEADAFGTPNLDLARREELFARLVLDGRADGLIAAFATLEDRLVARLSERGVPLVLVNRRQPGIPGSVAVDDVRAARMVVRHLIDLGHERIGFVGIGQLTDTARRREQGLREELAAAGLHIDPRWIASGEPLKKGGYEAVSAILAASRSGVLPTALFCASLLSAIGALAALRDHSIAVPTQMSVAAFNDHEIADDTAPPLTTVRLPNLQMGREAIRMAVSAAEGLPLAQTMIKGPIDVIRRASTGPPPRG